MKKVKVLLFLILNLQILASEVPNVVIQDNPNKETSIINLERRKKNAELEINVTKLTSEEITAIHSKSENKYYFNLPEKVKINEDIFVTNNKDVLLKRKIIGNTLEYSYSDDIVVIDDRNNLDSIYIVKYHKSNKSLSKLYKWDGRILEKNIFNKSLELEFLSTYNPYEEIILNNLKLANKVTIKSGEILKLEDDTKTVEICDITGKKIEEIEIIKGNGHFGLGMDTSGIKLTNTNGFLKTGIGFRNGNLILKLKEWSSKENKYDMILKIKSVKEELQYKLSIITPKMGIKVLNNKINFDFGNINSKNRFSSTVTSSVDISVPKDTTSIDVKFSENYDVTTKTGTMTLLREEGIDTIRLKLKIEGILEKGEGILEGTKLYNIPISSKIDEDISNKPNGTYNGKTELIISVDS